MHINAHLDDDFVADKAARSIPTSTTRRTEPRTTVRRLAA